MNIAFIPAMKKKTPMPNRYWIPTTLWSVQSPK